MAHITQSYSELANRLQRVVGLTGKSLASLDVSIHVGVDQIVKTTVTFVEFTEVDQQEGITEVVEYLHDLSGVTNGG